MLKYDKNHIFIDTNSKIQQQKNCVKSCILIAKTCRLLVNASYYGDWEVKITKYFLNKITFYQKNYS
ncbi:MAG TPA: hypothetical protein DER05_09925 [Lutibacter sp.]|nr:hypothetical protein [Lutibacter sp.]